MKKVYLIIDEGCYDCEGSTDVRVYENYKKAKQDFDDSREQLIADWVDRWQCQTCLSIAESRPRKPDRAIEGGKNK